MELRDSPGLASALVLQVEASDQVVVTPNVLAHQVNLKGDEIVVIYELENEKKCTQNETRDKIWGVIEMTIHICILASNSWNKITYAKNDLQQPYFF